MRIERLVQVIGADGGHPSRFLSELFEVHLRRLQLLREALGTQMQRQHRQAHNLDLFLPHGRQAARIHRIDLYVASRCRLNGVNGLLLNRVEGIELEHRDPSR